MPDPIPACAGEGPPLPDEEAATSARDRPPGGVFTGGDRTREAATSARDLSPGGIFTGGDRARDAATSARDLPPGGVFAGGDRTRFTAGCFGENVATTCASSSNDILFGFGGGLAGGTCSPAFAGQGGSGEGLACPV